MSGKYYMLVNPYIEGATPKVFKADNSLKAAKMAYETLSEYFNNSVHNFKFTLLKLKSDSINAKSGKTNNFDLEQYGGSSNNKRFNTTNFTHFTVSEKINRNQTVDYEIKTYTGKIENLQHLIDNVMRIQQKFIKANKSGKKVSRLSESQNSESADSEQTGSGSNSRSSSEQSGSGSSSGSSSSNGSSESSNNSSNSSSHQVGGADDNTSSSYQIGGADDNTSSSYQIGGADDNTSSSYQIGGADDNTSSSSYSGQIGGKKSKSKYEDDDDDDDDDDDSPDYYVKNYHYDPISYWYYSPSVYSLDRLYLPTFVSPLSFPYVLDMSPVISYNTTPNSGNPTVNSGF
jgi:hypothetical protein